MLRTLFRDGTVYTIPTIFTRGLSLLLVPLYTRVLSPTDYGSLDLLMVFASIVNLTVALEVSQGLARYYSIESDVESKVDYASSAFWFTLFCYSIFAVFALVYSEGLAEVVIGRKGVVTVFRIGILYVLINGIFYFIQNQFRWESRSKRYATVSMLVTSTTASVAIFFVFVLRWALEGLLLGMLVGLMVGVVYGLWYLRDSFQFRFKSACLRTMLLFSAPLVPSGIAVFISAYIDRLMINHYLTTDAVGIYGIAFRLAGIVGLVMEGFQSALTPLVYAHYRDKKTPDHLARIFRFFLSFALLTFISVTLFSNEILVLMTTSTYYSAASLTIFIVPAIFLSNMYIFAPGISIANKNHLILFINVFGAMAHIISNLILIPLYGISGAAISAMLGYGLIFAIYMILSQKLYFVPHEWTRLLVATLLIAVLTFSIRHLTLQYSTLLILKFMGIIIAVFIVFVTGLIRKAELFSLKRMVKRREF